MDHVTSPKLKRREDSTFKPLNTQPEKNIKILVVEDNPLIQCVIEQMLAKLGHSADFAEDGKTALALYHSHYALILMDIELPDFTGIEVTQTIRKIEKKQDLPHTPIIAITSHHDEPEFQEKCFEAGMNDCSGKPNLIQLKQWISEYIATQYTH